MSLKRKFIRFVLPSIASMLVFNLYTMVDGIFIANYAGETALAAVNLAMPFINFMFAFSLLLSIGASTLISIHRYTGDGVVTEVADAGEVTQTDLLKWTISQADMKLALAKTSDVGSLKAVVTYKPKAGYEDSYSDVTITLSTKVNAIEVAHSSIRRTKTIS